ncbi:DUF58 domain-containing protein [Aquibacillus koreensis]|uniref:DUF58 domain-containing protein n=1 Tax=Aquibacillus koreensis TaxID=279446 RepID=A0A9X3WL62_9BACI|nr:DUF58 domain-containing protein [Aquibacillus koreensis]MCT2534235.1 DUF58 domain-containing protein [Aquibacillus koreensis]MDC3420720.1 DUF58 domain-containing protein [Aquibacillus koreensis]
MSIPWIIAITIVFIIVQMFMYEKWGITNIRYNRRFSHSSVFSGEQIEMIDEISNNKWLPVPWLRLESKISSQLRFKKNTDLELEENPEEEFHRTLFSLLPYQKITRRHKVTCQNRGYYSLQTVSMTTGDVFGFTERFRTLESSATVIVYPTLLPIDEVPLPSHSWLGDITVRRWIIEDPFVFAGVREYASGDSMNAVNWKATARTGQLQVSQKDFTADHHLMIYVNFDQTEDIWWPIENEQLIENALSYAASVANHSIKNGISTGFGCNAYLTPPFSDTTKKVKESVRIEPETGMEHFYYMLDTIAKVKMDRSRNFNQFLLEDIEEQRSNTDFLIITSLVTDKMKQHVHELEMLGNAIEIMELK